MNFFVTNAKFYAPGISSADEWKLWRDGKMQIAQEKSAPKLEFADPLFRRRFSQITKMTVQVIHDVVACDEKFREKKIVFASFRGEICRQLSVNRMIAEEKSILPAAFSLSVFNTPVAAATIALEMKGGYSVVYPSKGNFASAFLCGASSVLCGEDDEIIFCYADEKIPDEYESFAGKNFLPLAFACVIGKNPSADAKEFSAENLPQSPQEFLKALI